MESSDHIQKQAKSNAPTAEEGAAEVVISSCWPANFPTRQMLLRARHSICCLAF